MQAKALLISFNQKLLSANLFALQNSFDQALEIYAGVESSAYDKGCLPILFKALVFHGEVLDICGKKSQLINLLNQTGNVYEKLIDGFPSGTSIDNLMMIKEYRLSR